MHNPVNKCYWCNCWPIAPSLCFLKNTAGYINETEAAAPARVTRLKYLEVVKMEELLLLLKLLVSKRQGDILPGSPIITFQMFHKRFFWGGVCHCFCLRITQFVHWFFTFRHKFLSNAWQANLRWLYMLKTDIYQFKHLICTLCTTIINNLRDHCILFLLTIW